MKKKTFIPIAAAAVLMPAGAWADDLAYLHEERPAACKEATARIVAATGGHFRAGERVAPSTYLRDDTVDVAGNEVMIDCGASPEAISATMDTEEQYPPNEWFAAASKVAHGLTGDPLNELQKVLRTGKQIKVAVGSGTSGINGPVVITLTAPATGNPGASAACVSVAAATILAIRADPTQFRPQHSVPQRRLLPI